MNKAQQVLEALNKSNEKVIKESIGSFTDRDIINQAKKDQVDHLLKLDKNDNIINRDEIVKKLDAIAKEDDYYYRLGWSGRFNKDGSRIYKESFIVKRITFR